MNRDYSVLLQNLLTRRFDEALNKSIVSPAFEACNYPDSLKYVMESMQELDPAYTYQTFHITQALQDKLEKALSDLGMSIEIRYQGPIQTETHVTLYGGIEMLIITDSRGQKPWISVQNIAKKVIETIGNDPEYSKVDYSDRLKITVKTAQQPCELKILPAVWIDNAEYLESKREIDRGISEFDLKNKTMRKYLPFRNIARVNAISNRTKGGLKQMIRLIRNMQLDCEVPVELNNYEVSSILYWIDYKKLKYNPKKPLSLLPGVSEQFGRILKDKNYREQLTSPSGKEMVFSNKSSQTEEVTKLKRDLDLTILDLSDDLKKMKLDFYSDIDY